MSRPNPKCPACGKRGQKFRWSRNAAAGPPIHIECPHCDWCYSAHGLELTSGMAPWNTHGHPQARLAADWFTNWSPIRKAA